MKRQLIATLFCSVIDSATMPPGWADPTGPTTSKNVGKVISTPAKPTPAPANNGVTTQTHTKPATAPSIKHTATATPSNSKVPPVTSATPLKTKTPGAPAATQTSMKTASGKSITAATPSTKPVSSNVSTTANSQKPIALQGHLKRHKHKHPFESLLKEEFDSPIHPVETDNKDF